jgi:glucokinase
MTDRSPSRHLGLDLGGTNIKWVVLDRDGEAWRAIDREQVPTPARNDPDAVVGRLASLGSEVVERHPAIATVGIGVPGLYDPVAGTVRFLVNFPGAWAGRPIAREVGAALGLPVALLNDARAFGLAEHRLGAGRGVSTMVGLTLGTGVGGCVVVDGRLLLNHDGAVGEIGHQTIEPDGPWCNCGNRGCLEAFARADQVAAACGTATAEEAVERARAGDARAIEGLAELGRYLGIGIGNTVAILAPDRVGITSLDLVEIVPAELGTWAGAIGAAIHGAEATADAGAAGGTPAATATAAGGRP